MREKVTREPASLNVGQRDGIAAICYILKNN
jgi:hypothetical protein